MNFLLRRIPFAMRPPIRAKLASTPPCHIAVVLPHTTAANLPMPELNDMLVTRDVHEHDWMSFTNHLISNMYARLDHDIAKAGQDIQRIKATVNEWNRDFFLLRGIEIVLRTELHTITVCGKSEEGGKRQQRRRAWYEPKTLYSSRPSRLETSNCWKCYRCMAQKSIPANLMMERLCSTAAYEKSHARTLLYWNVIHEKNGKLIRLLLNHGANSNAEVRGDGTVLKRLVNKGMSDMVELWLQ